MNYFKCKDCWRIYTQQQIMEDSFGSCPCGSVRFKGRMTASFIRRFCTDWKYTIKSWIRERLNHEQNS